MDVFNLSLGDITSSIFGSFMFATVLGFIWGLMRFILFGVSERRE